MERLPPELTERIKSYCDPIENQFNCISGIAPDVFVLHEQVKPFGTEFASITGKLYKIQSDIDLWQAKLDLLQYYVYEYDHAAAPNPWPLSDILKNKIDNVNKTINKHYLWSGLRIPRHTWVGVAGPGAFPRGEVLPLVRHFRHFHRRARRDQLGRDHALVSANVFSQGERQLANMELNINEFPDGRVELEREKLAWVGIIDSLDRAKGTLTQRINGHRQIVVDGRSRDLTNIPIQRLKMCGLANINFNGAILNNVDFSRTDLSGCNFSDCSLINANFSNCRLDGAKFYGANLENANFNSTPLDNIIFGFENQYIMRDYEHSTPQIVCSGNFAAKNIPKHVLDAIRALSSQRREQRLATSLPVVRPAGGGEDDVDWPENIEGALVEEAEPHPLTGYQEWRAADGSWGWPKPLTFNFTKKKSRKRRRRSRKQTRRSRVRRSKVRRSRVRRSKVRRSKVRRSRKQKSRRRSRKRSSRRR